MLHVHKRVHWGKNINTSQLFTGAEYRPIALPELNPRTHPPLPLHFSLCWCRPWMFQQNADSLVHDDALSCLSIQLFTEPLMCHDTLFSNGPTDWACLRCAGLTRPALV